jgi:AcrR family transcriptional regulator
LSDAATLPTRPGRPPTGARDRLLEAGLEVMKADGYAGLTIAKVAARAGENKALIAYHFGSKQGLVAAVAASLGEQITSAVVEAVDGRHTIEGIVRGALAGVWDLMDSDERLARLYFDLGGVSVVEEDVRRAMSTERSRWRTVLMDLLRDTDPRVPAGRIEPLAILIGAGIEGLALERIQVGETRALGRARELFVASMSAAARTG